MQNSLCESPLWDFHHSSCKNVDENRICLSKILASDFRQTETFVVFLSAVAIIGDHIFPRKKQTVALKGTEGRFVLFLVFPLLYSSLFLAWSLHTDPKGKFQKIRTKVKGQKSRKKSVGTFLKNYNVASASVECSTSLAEVDSANCVPGTEIPPAVFTLFWFSSPRSLDPADSGSAE